LNLETVSDSEGISHASHRSYNSISATAGHKEALGVLLERNPHSGNAIPGIATDKPLGKTYLVTSNTYFGLAHTPTLQVT
jgi:hypothetical protein